MIMLKRLLGWLTTLWLLAGAAGVGLLPVLAPTIITFLLGGLFLVSTMLSAWLVARALPTERRLRIRFAFLATAPPIGIALLLRGDWFGAIWPGLLTLGALLRTSELLLRHRSGPPTLGR